MRYQYVLLIVGVIFIGCTQMPSNIYPTSREITINTDSTRIFAQFLIKPARVNPKDNLRYYWYYTDKISSNVGGYNGNLLNGNYRVLSRENLLVVQGSFSNGLMDGVWKYWYSNGNIKKVETWKNGILKGFPVEYNQDGSLIQVEKGNEIAESNDNLADSTATKRPWYKRILGKERY